MGSSPTSSEKMREKGHCRKGRAPVNTHVSAGSADGTVWLENRNGQWEVGRMWATDIL